MASSSLNPHFIIHKCGLCCRYFDKAALVHNRFYFSCKDCQDLEDPSSPQDSQLPLLRIVHITRTVLVSFLRYSRSGSKSLMAN